MSFVIERDNGKGNPPSFLKVFRPHAGAEFGALADALPFKTEAEAVTVRDTYFGDCIVVPNDEEVFAGTSEKSVEELSGMELDTGQNKLIPSAQPTLGQRIATGLGRLFSK